MNIESILNKMNLFDDLVVKSGFDRDLTDTINSLTHQHNQSLDFLNRATLKIMGHLQSMVAAGLPLELPYIIKEAEHLSIDSYYDQISQLHDDKSLEVNSFFSEFSAILNQMQQVTLSNKNELLTSRMILDKFVSKKYDQDENQDQENGLISLVFKDLKSTTSLVQFSKALANWNKILCMYHSLLKAESPTEVSLTEIQNGSIDVLINIDLEVAISLAELIEYGYKAFAAYLLYKAQNNMVGLYITKKAENAVKTIDKEIIVGIEAGMLEKATLQYSSAKKLNDNISDEGTDVKIKQVVKAVKEHIIKGNDVKFLSATTNTDEDSTELSEEELIEYNSSVNLKKASNMVKTELAKLGDADKIKLIEDLSEE